MANAFDSAEIIIDSHWGYDPSAIAAVDPATPGAIKTVLFQRVGNQPYVDASAASVDASSHLPAYDYALTSCPLILMEPYDGSSVGPAAWEWTEPSDLSSFSVFMAVEVSSVSSGYAAVYNFAMGDGIYFEVDNIDSNLDLIVIKSGAVTEWYEDLIAYQDSIAIALAYDGDASTLQCSINGSLVVDATGVDIDASSMGYLGWNGQGASSRVRLQSLYPTAYNSVSLNAASLSILNNMLP